MEAGTTSCHIWQFTGSGDCCSEMFGMGRCPESHGYFEDWHE